MTEKQAFDRQLEREIDVLAGPEPRVDVRAIVETATHQRMRDRRSWPGGAFRAAVAGVLVAAIGFMLVWARPSDDQAVVPPAATPSGLLEPSPSTAVGTTTPVSGTWHLPEPQACREQLPRVAEGWVSRIEVCDGLRVEAADDPRLTGAGVVRRKTWVHREAPEQWRLTNAGGTWESERYHDHDRFVFRGRGGYDGLTAVVTLAADGTVSGFVRTGEPRENDE